MKSRIPKVLLSLACAVPIICGAIHVLPSVTLSSVLDAVWFYRDLPDRLNDAVANFKMLPERMDPTCSECSEP